MDVVCLLSCFDTEHFSNGDTPPWVWLVGGFSQKRQPDVLKGVCVCICIAFAHKQKVGCMLRGAERCDKSAVQQGNGEGMLGSARRVYNIMLTWMYLTTYCKKVKEAECVCTAPRELEGLQPDDALKHAAH